MIKVRTRNQKTQIKCPNPNCKQWISVGIVEAKSGIAFVCDGCKKKWTIHKI